MSASDAAGESSSAVPVDSRAFREALGSFATGVTVVTSVGADGRLLGLTASSFNSVSLEPPLVLFSLDRGAYSLADFQRSGHFAVNVLSEEQEGLSVTFAKALADKWDGVRFEVWETGSPILTDALASFECRTRYNYDGGDHVIFVGEVVRMRANRGGRPLLYFRGDYGRLGRGP